MKMTFVTFLHFYKISFGKEPKNALIKSIRMNEKIPKLTCLLNSLEAHEAISDKMPICGSYIIKPE